MELERVSLSLPLSFCRARSTHRMSSTSSPPQVGRYSSTRS